MAPDLPEWSDPAFLKQQKWLPWRESLLALHKPQGEADLGLHALPRLRLAYDEKDVREGFEATKREGRNSFGDDRVLIEKYILSPRHIEVQVFGDSHGNVVHLFERDCSLQRRHQKVIEEAPAPGMGPETREALCAAAVRAAKAVDYVGAGTVEFIADASEGLRADRIWFMEMNTRLQVEHPVTDEITGVDLVEWQLRVASGEALPRRQDDLAINGWAIEARLYAENPSSGFLPSTGPLDRLRLPVGIRVDTGVEEGGEVTPFYDPMIAKLVVHAPTRREAAEQLSAAAATVEVWPVRTNAAFLSRAAGSADFVAERIDTGFIERHGEALVPAAEPSDAIVAGAGAAILPLPAKTPWTDMFGFRANAAPERSVGVEVAGILYRTVPSSAHNGRVADVAGVRIFFADGEAWPFGPPRVEGGSGAGAMSDGAILAPMPGRIVSLNIAQGQRVTKGQKLLVLEAMKMEHALLAPFDGAVVELAASGGEQVSEGSVLARVERAEDQSA